MVWYHSLCYTIAQTSVPILDENDFYLFLAMPQQTDYETYNETYNYYKSIHLSICGAGLVDAWPVKE